MILEKLGIYGWKEKKESLVLAALLTGDPLLLIGTHGTAKTYLAKIIARALEEKFIVYDASKALFEDVLGYPNIEKLKSGVVDYIPSPVTVWDKSFVLIDELNRALAEMQNKWLELIRSRRIMGYPTSVRWVWAAMNPLSYSATETLDEALIGRFALFLYPPQVLEMEEKDRAKVAQMNGEDDAPAIGRWTEDGVKGTVSWEEVKKTGMSLKRILRKASFYFNLLRADMNTLPEFLAKFSQLLFRESKGKISLDGRRLGFIYRNLLANRAVELAKSELLGKKPPEFSEQARYIVQASIPIGINDEEVKKEEDSHKIEICIDLLSSYFEPGSNLDRVNHIYELFTTKDLIRKAELLLTMDLGELAQSKAWNDLAKSEKDVSILAYVALQAEARKPGTVPKELLEALSQSVHLERFCSSRLNRLRGENVEYIEEVETLLEQETSLGLVVAFERVRNLIKKDSLSLRDIRNTDKKIKREIRVFESFLNSGGESNEDL